jgi:hypothetical protein
LAKVHIEIWVYQTIYLVLLIEPGTGNIGKIGRILFC